MMLERWMERQKERPVNILSHNGINIKYDIALTA